ncbi:MAG: diacylglycerol kinase family protein [Bacillota bacterium]
MDDRRPSSRSSDYRADPGTDSSRERNRRHAPFLSSLSWAVSGVAEATRRERNLRIHWTVAYLVLAAGLFLDFLTTDWLWVTLAITLVIVTELINTAVEAAVDFAGIRPDPAARLAKDAAAGAVLVASFFSLIVAGLVIVARNPDPSMIFRRAAGRPGLATILAAGFVGMVIWVCRGGHEDGRKC